MEYYAHEYNTIEQFQNEFCGAENTTCKPKRLQLNITIETRESNNNNNNKRIPKKQQNKIKKQQQQQQLTCKITFIFLYFSFSFISFFRNIFSLSLWICRRSYCNRYRFVSYQTYKIHDTSTIYNECVLVVR